MENLDGVGQSQDLPDAYCLLVYRHSEGASYPTPPPPPHPDWWKSTFFKVPRLRPFVPPARATCRYRWVWSVGAMVLTGEHRSTRRETSPSTTSFTTSLLDHWGIELGLSRWDAGEYETNLEYIWRSYSYRAVKTLRLDYKNLYFWRFLSGLVEVRWINLLKTPVRSCEQCHGSTGMLHFVM